MLTVLHIEIFIRGIYIVFKGFMVLLVGVELLWEGSAAHAHEVER